MKITINVWKHIGAAVALGSAVAIGEYLTNSVNTDTIIGAFVAGYTGSYTFQSLVARIEAAFAGMASKVSAAIEINNGSAPATPTPVLKLFTLSVSNLTAAIGDSVTYTLIGGVANGTATLYQVGLPQDNSGAVSGTLQLDAKGACTWTATLSRAGPIGGVISAEGSISIYAVDSADSQSNSVTLS